MDFRSTLHDGSTTKDKSSIVSFMLLFYSHSMGPGGLLVKSKKINEGFNPFSCSKILFNLSFGIKAKSAVMASMEETGRRTKLSWVSFDAAKGRRMVGHCQMTFS